MARWREPFHPVSGEREPDDLRAEGEKLRRGTVFLSGEERHDHPRRRYHARRPRLVFSPSFCPRTRIFTVTIENVATRTRFRILSSYTPRYSSAENVQRMLFKRAERTIFLHCIIRYRTLIDKSVHASFARIDESRFHLFQLLQNLFITFSFHDNWRMKGRSKADMR